MEYSIRILVRHPTLSIDEISRYLNTEPTYSRTSDQTSDSQTAWSVVSWTEGNRRFFTEVDEVIDWLERRPEFISAVRHGGGKVCVIAQLSGKENIGDELSPNTMARAAAIGVSIGVEVFPNMTKPRETRR
ncbi:DUF4279 domain-containing protein [Roseateles sp. L2-2]|uniref:DUF4279 domain-containing protein n=1 Tax=Roseateles sp. L2-2 TaxID=3422597 RepID=UPI003D36AE75